MHYVCILDVTECPCVCVAYVLAANMVKRRDRGSSLANCYGMKCRDSVRALCMLQVDWLS